MYYRNDTEIILFGGWQ